MNCTKFNFLFFLLFAIITNGFGQESDGWVSLFNGESFEGWHVGENPSTFTIDNGTIKVAGDIAHLFYTGEVADHNFTDFEFKAMVMTKPGANSGIYIHTEFQKSGWPAKGYEVQVNNSQEDWRRTGSLYAIMDVKEKYVKDNEWYTEYIKVEGKRIIIKINGIVTVDYTEPEQPIREDWAKERILNSGTFALQGHDPGSVIYYKDIMVRLLD